MAAPGRGAYKVVVKVVALAALFVGSFIFFLALTFPYEVLKETLAAELSQATGYTIRIGDLKASLPLGVAAKDVTIETRTGAVLAFTRVEASASVFWLLFGKLKAGAEIGIGDGELSTDAELSVLDLIGQHFIPRRVTVSARGFPIEQLAAFGLRLAAAAPNAQMVGPLLSVIGITGKLSGDVDLKLDPKDVTQSKGAVELALMGAVLRLSDPSIGLPDQTFSKALVKAKVTEGALEIDKNSGFVSDELRIAAEGRMKLKPDLPQSLLDMRLIFNLDKGLKDKFGWVVDALTGTGTGEGKFTLEVRGTVGAANVRPI